MSKTFTNEEIAEQLVGILVRNQVKKDAETIQQCCEAARRAFDRETLDWSSIAAMYRRFYKV